MYVMEAAAPERFVDPSVDLAEAIRGIGRNYREAVEKAEVKRVVHLSGIGAHTDHGNSLRAFHYQVEKILETLPREAAIAFMRPVAFYENLLGFYSISIKRRSSIRFRY